MATAPATIDVMLLRQGEFLFAVPTREVLGISQGDEPTGHEGERRISLEEFLALGRGGLDSGALRLVRIDLGPCALSLEVTGSVSHGSLPSGRVQPLPSFVAGVRRSTGIGGVFESEERSIGFLLEPEALRERVCQ